MGVRPSLIRLASSLPQSSGEGRTLLRFALDFPTQEALDKYLDEHPHADKAKHRVVETERPSSKPEEESPEVSHESEVAPVEPTFKGKLRSLLRSVKNVPLRIKEDLHRAPEAVHTFFTDKEKRRETLSAASTALKKSPEKISRAVYDSAKAELHDLKHAGQALKKVLRKPPQKWTKEDRAAVYSAAVYAAAAAVSLVGGGPLMAAGMVGKRFATHVGAKAMSRVMDQGFLHFEAAETAHHILEHVLHFASEEHSDEDYEKLLMTHLTAATASVLGEGLDDADIRSILQGEKEPDMKKFPQPSVKTAKANVTPVRQRTQYSCMACSMSMALRALGFDTNEDEVNKVMGAAPMKGAAWEQALATAQHYGCRATLTVPATLKQIKEWTDAGIPVMIAWNPEGRDWSHASLVFDVDDDWNVHVADPNIPDPDETVRVVSKAEFYKKWFEKFPNYLVRRPACAIEREVTIEGKQVLAAKKTVPVPPVKPDPNKITGPSPTRRNLVVQGLIERGSAGAGGHKSKKDYVRHPKHRGEDHEASAHRVANRFKTK